MPKISIVTPTIRKEGLDVVWKSLKKQTFTDWEWLIGSKFDPEIPGAVWVKDNFKGGFWTLNRTYNKLFKKAQGELIVSWQDWIWIPPDGLEKFWIAYGATNKDALITGVGDQYERLNEFGKPEVKVWMDPRRTLEHGSFYEVNFQDIEFNWGALPRKLVYGVGGADEELDFLGLGAEIYSISDRLNDLGKKFFIDQTNESYSIRHGREAFGGQKEWDAKNTFFNGKYIERKKQLINDEKWFDIGYLTR
jgi:hypothetical protein